MDSIQRRTTRRQFLKLAGVTGAAALLAACAPAATAPTAAPAAAAGQATQAPGAPTAAAPAANASGTINIFDFGGDNDKKIYADAIARFNKTSPNVKVIDNF